MTDQTQFFSSDYTDALDALDARLVPSLTSLIVKIHVCHTTRGHIGMD